MESRKSSKWRLKVLFPRAFAINGNYSEGKREGTDITQIL